MIGYWIVTTMMLVAAAGVVLSFRQPAPMSDVDIPNSGNSADIASTTHQPSAVLSHDSSAAATTPAGDPSTATIRIAVVGASDVTGEGLSNPETDNWAAVLADLTPARTTVQSFGSGGAWLATAGPHLTAARQWEPHIVAIWLVVNDLTQGEALARYCSRLEESIADFTSAGIPVIVGDCPQLWTLPAFQGDDDDLRELRDAVMQWNGAVAAIAQRHQAVVVNLSQHATDPDDVLPDGLHPSAAGHRRLAAAFAPAIAAVIDQHDRMRLNQRR